MTALAAVLGLLLLKSHQASAFCSRNTRGDCWFSVHHTNENDEFGRGIRFTSQTKEDAAAIRVIPKTVGLNSIMQFHVGGKEDEDIRLEIAADGTVNVHSDMLFPSPDHAYITHTGTGGGGGDLHVASAEGRVLVEGVAVSGTALHNVSSVHAAPSATDFVVGFGGAGLSEAPKLRIVGRDGGGDAGGGGGGPGMDVVIAAGRGGAPGRVLISGGAAPAQKSAAGAFGAVAINWPGAAGAVTAGAYSLWVGGQIRGQYSTIATTSDARLKTNVTNTDVYDCLETINKLRVVDFHWKSAAAKAGYAAPHETTGGGQPVPCSFSQHQIAIANCDRTICMRRLLANDILRSLPLLFSKERRPRARPDRAGGRGRHPARGHHRRGRERHGPERGRVAPDPGPRRRRRGRRGRHAGQRRGRARSQDRAYGEVYTELIGAVQALSREVDALHIQLATMDEMRHDLAEKVRAMEEAARDD